jgi:molecular chaperone Hsp33
MQKFMNNHDSIQNFLFENLPIRGEIVHLNASFQQIMEQHNYPPLIRRWLGEALVLIALLSTLIKFNGKLALQFQGKGKLKLLLVQCNNELHLRGLAQWDGELSEADILSSLKQGTIVITIDPENGKQRYQGIVAWQGETLSESIEGYFQNSEQLATRIWVAVDEKSASGFLLQRMPEQDELKRESLLDHDWEHINYLTATLTPHELSNLDTKTLLHRLYVEEDLRLFEPKPLIFRCTCSVQRGANAILTLGQKEAEEELEDKQQIVVKCEFCNHEYAYDRVDVATIFRKGDDFTSSKQVH